MCLDSRKYKIRFSLQLINYKGNIVNMFKLFDETRGHIELMGKVKALSLIISCILPGIIQLFQAMRSPAAVA